MGWSSGTSLMEAVIVAIQANVPDEEVRYNLYEEIVDAFQDADWDNLDEVVGIDPAYDRLYKLKYGEDVYE